MKNESRRVKIITATGLCGIILISMSGLFSSDKSDYADAQSSSQAYSEYESQTEEKLCDIVSSIDGVGECKVMITFENTNESIYATDNESKTDEASHSSSDEYVIYDSENGETPILLNEKYPTVMGVSVVCSGAGNTAVREDIINTVTSLFNISANRVSVSKIKSKGD